MRRTLGRRTPTAEIRAALEAATPGPWEASTSEATMNDRNEWTFRRMGPPTVPMHFRAVMQSADARLIAAAPAWLAELCDRLEAAEAKLAAVRELHRPKRTQERLPNGVSIPWTACSCGFRTHSACPTLRALDGEQP